MHLSSLLSIVLALQGATNPPSQKPVPIATAIAEEGGPAAEIPASLARLPGPDAIAVMFVPSVARAEEAIERISGVGGPLADGMPLGGTPLRRMLKDSVRTDLEVPLDQPVLWWIDKPQVAEDEPGMGLGNVVMHQAMRITGATAAQEKARAAAAAASDPKSRPAMPVRAARRGMSVTVLADDLVVTSSDMEPFAAPTDGAQPSALLKGLPRGLVSGRIDLGRVLEEEGDQLRMLGGFVAMSMNQEEGDDASMTPEQIRRAEMRRTFAEALGNQATSAIEALMQLKRASFALELEGDELHAFADWSRTEPFPAGLSDRRARETAERLPGGMPIYFGISSNALDTIYGDRVSIDDAIATLGATPEARKAWLDACARVRQAVAQVDEGMVLGLSSTGEDATMQAAFRVKDAAAFRAAIRDAATLASQAGLFTARVQEAGETLGVEIAPSADRLREILSAVASDAVVDEDTLRELLLPEKLAFNFKGNEVLLAQAHGDRPAAAGAGGDVRPTLGRGAWGTADWFATVDLRHAAVGMGDDAPSAAAEIAKLRAGKPAPLHLWQGVKGGTARLSVRSNLADLRELMVDVNAVESKLKAAAAGNASGKSGEKADDDDDDDDDDPK